MEKVEKINITKLPPGQCHIHFIGIGGVGAAPLAGIVREQGHNISGSDLELNAKTAELVELGATICRGHHAEHLPADTALVVYSAAVPADNQELAAARERAIPCLGRGRFLAAVAAQFRRPVAISGSHGKTSVTALLAWILRQNGIACGYLIGGAVNGFPSYAAGDGDIFIFETDESDGSHALLKPWLGVVTNVEDDHAWSVGGADKLFDNFARFAAQSERLFYFPDANSQRLFKEHPNAVHFQAKTADFPTLTGFIKTNAALAAAAAELLNIPTEISTAAIASFPGVARRMAVRYSSPRLAVVEDYAHHPTEIRAAMSVLRTQYPGYHLRMVFQPHRYARLQKYFDQFALELRQADSIFILPVFAAWSEKGEVSASKLTAATGKHATCLDCSGKQTAKALLAPVDQPLLLAILGAGDIEKIIPEILAAIK